LNYLQLLPGPVQGRTIYNGDETADVLNILKRFGIHLRMTASMIVAADKDQPTHDCPSIICRWALTSSVFPVCSRNIRHSAGLAYFGVRRAKAAFLSGCESHPANLLQPEAIGAVMEVTKWLKPSV